MGLIDMMDDSGWEWDVKDSKKAQPMSTRPFDISMAKPVRKRPFNMAEESGVWNWDNNGGN